MLHYLQMATEKLSKAYLWRSGNPPPRKHTGFVRFLKALLSRGQTDRERIAKVLGFARERDLDYWVFGVLALAYRLQNIAPTEACDGPNPEYPWPHEAPVHSPVTHSFAMWNQLCNTGQGRKLMEIVDRAIRHFEHYA